MKPDLNVLFLDKYSAWETIRRDPYFESIDDWSDLDKRAKLGLSTKDRMPTSSEILDIYLKSVMEFSEEEKEVLERYCKELYTHLLKKYKSTMMVSQTDFGRFEFMKVSDHLEWGFPRTLRRTILLPEKFVSKCVFMSKNSQYWNEEGEDCIRTVLHEKYHILQKEYSDFFGRVYSIWGFEKNTRIVNNMLLENPEIRKRVITNPDGANEWVFPVLFEGETADKWGSGYRYVLIPMLLLSEMDNRTHESWGFIVDSASYSVVDKGLLSKYRNIYRYASTPQGYHPDEIFAVIHSASYPRK